VEFLLLRRRTDVVMADCWQAISGKLRAYERISHTFVRQLLANWASSESAAPVRGREELL